MMTAGRLHLGDRVKGWESLVECLDLVVLEDPHSLRDLHVYVGVDFDVYLSLQWQNESISSALPFDDQGNGGFVGGDVRYAHSTR